MITGTSMIATQMTETAGQALHRALCALRKQQIQSEADLALGLAEFDQIREFAALGFGSIRDYAEAYLALSPRQTMDFVRLGRALPRMPLLHAAFEAGELGTAKARELLRVIDGENEERWVQFAVEVTCRTLEHAVAAAELGDPAPAPGEMPIGPARVRLSFEVDAAEADLFRAALTHLRGSNADADDGALLAQMAHIVMSGGSDAGPEAIPEARYRIVLERCPSCQELTHVGESGLREVSPAMAAEAECHHETVDMEHPAHPGRLTRSIPETVSRQVAHRDRYRCAIPRCQNRHWLNYHHLKHHADGGENTVANLCLLCTVHHKLVHAGVLELERANDGGLHVSYLR